MVHVLGGHGNNAVNYRRQGEQQIVEGDARKRLTGLPVVQTAVLRDQLAELARWLRGRVQCKVLLQPCTKYSAAFHWPTGRRVIKVVHWHPGGAVTQNWDGKRASRVHAHDNFKLLPFLHHCLLTPNKFGHVRLSKPFCVLYGRLVVSVNTAVVGGKRATKTASTQHLVWRRRRYYSRSWQCLCRRDYSRTWQCLCRREWFLPRLGSFTKFTGGKSKNARHVLDYLPNPIRKYQVGIPPCAFCFVVRWSFWSSRGEATRSTGSTIIRGVCKTYTQNF